MEDTQNEMNGEQHDDSQQELAAARQAAAENRDKYLRALAESENMRKRLERLCEERMWQEKKRLVGHLLEVSDQLEEALKYASSDDALGTGVRLTYQQLQQVLNREGAQVVSSVGEIFDPSIHEAVEIANSPGHEDQVVQEYHKGYTLDGKLLRPARVQVAKSS
jgi:molecular chaperone GrpE